MVDAETGHVFDAIRSDGSVDTTLRLARNEGLFIGAIVALATATSDRGRLALAEKSASYMLASESASTPLGTVLSDGKCSGVGALSKAIASRHLGELYALEPSHVELRDLLRRSADAAWTFALDLSKDDIACDWAGPYDSTTGGLGSLGAAAAALAAAAKALGPGAQRPPLRYEAEESDLHGVGIGNDKGGYSGWGYIVGWGSDGKSIDFVVTIPAADRYLLNARYATGGDARRVVRVNGAVATPAFEFPSTGGYTIYGTTGTAVDLPAGLSTISIVFDAATGGAGYVNLDRIDLTVP